MQTQEVTGHVISFLFLSWVLLAGFGAALELFSKEHLVCFTEVKVRDGVWYRHINNFPEVNYFIRVRVSATLCFTEARVRLKVRVIG